MTSTISTDRSAVVTGASSGIGRATALNLAQRGYRVFAVARRAERLEELVQEGASAPGEIVAVQADVTNEDDVARLVANVEAQGGVATVLNIAGGALGTDRLADASAADWEWMFQVNVIGALKVTQGFLPMLRESGRGTVLNLTSTAGTGAYEGGSGYNAAKFAEHGITGALRLEEAENNIRVIEVLPGLVHTEEFSLKRLRGNQDAADAVYQGVSEPLTADDVAEVCSYSVDLPHHINLDQIVMRPVKQAAQHKLIRDAESK